MRLGRTAWLVLGIGACVIVLATLFLVYVRQSGEQGELTKNLTAAEAQLEKLISGREDAESQLPEKQRELAAAQSLLSRTQAIYPELTENIEYDEVLAELAHDCNLELMNMSAEEPNEEEVEDATYMVISFEVEVRGGVSNMLSMVNAIATDKRLTTTAVELVNIKTNIEAGLEPLGTIQFTGYSYQGE